MDQFPPSPWLYHKGCLKYFRKFAEILAAQSTPPVSLTPVANGKNLQSKIFIISLGHLWVVELAYRYMFSFKFILSCQQSDIVPVVCNRCRLHRWQFAAGVVVTGGKFAAGILDTSGKFATGINNTSETGGKICPPVSLIPVANLPPVSLTPVENLPPVVHLDLRISSQIFEKT